MAAAISPCICSVVEPQPSLPSRPGPLSVAAGQLLAVHPLLRNDEASMLILDGGPPQLKLLPGLRNDLVGRLARIRASKRPGQLVQRFAEYLREHVLTGGPLLSVVPQAVTLHSTDECHLVSNR